MAWLNEPYGYFLNCNSILGDFINSFKAECTDERTCLELASVGDGALNSCLVAPSLSSAAVSAPAPRTAHWSAIETDRKRLMTTSASGRQERNWHVSGVERGRDRGGRGLSFCASVDAGKGNMCGVSSWQLSSSSTSAWEGRGGEASSLFLLLWKTTLPSRLMLLPWRWAVLERGKRAKSVGCCQHNWERCSYFSLSLSLVAFRLLSLGH